MRRGFFDDWRNQGLFLIAANACTAGLAYHEGQPFVAGFIFGLVVMLYVTMLARAQIEREFGGF